MKENNLILIGKFGSAHGIKGFIKVHSFTDPLDNVLSYQPWLVKKGDVWLAKSFKKAEKRPKYHVVQMEDCTSRNDVEQYVNCDIAVDKSQLPCCEEDEFYWHELAGMAVKNVDEQSLGKVVDMIRTGANDVLVVEGVKRVLIPFLLDTVVLKIDRDSKTIRVDWSTEF